MSSNDIGRIELQLGLVPGLNSEDYIQARADARPRKRPDKLKCKPGFQQRGAACQRIRPKKMQVASPSRRSPGGGGRVAALIGGAIAGAALAGGVAAIAHRQQKALPPTASVIPPSIVPPSNGIKTAAIAGAAATASAAATLAIAHRQRQKAVQQAQIEAEAQVAAVTQEKDTQLQQKEREIRDRDRTQEETGKQVAQLHQEKKIAEEKLQKVEEASAQKDVELANATQAFDRARQQTEQLEVSHAELKKQSAAAIADKDKEIESYSEKLGEAEKRVADLETQVKALSEENETIAKTGEAGNAAIAGELKQARQQVQETQKQVAALSKEKETLVRENERASNVAAQELAKVREQIQSEQEKVKTLSSQRDQLAKTLEQERQMVAQKLQETKEIVKAEVTKSRQQGFEEGASSKVETEVAKARAEIEKARDEEVAAIDTKYANRVKEQVQAVEKQANDRILQEREALQKSYQQDLQKATDPKPGRGVKPDDVIRSPEGVHLGASLRRENSTFAMLSSAEKERKIANAADVAFDLAAKEAIAPTREAFLQRVDEIDASRESRREDLPGATLPEKEIIKSAVSQGEPNLIESKTQKTEREQYVRKSLAKLGVLEQEIARQAIREETYAAASEQIRTKTRERYLKAFSQLQARARQLGDYPPEAVDEFDKAAAKIHKEARKALEEVSRQVGDPDFFTKKARAYQQWQDEYEAPDVTKPRSLRELAEQERKVRQFSGLETPQAKGMDLDFNAAPKSDSYYEGRLDARKRSDKLKCKPGYVQRGAACQKIKPGASKVSSPQGRRRGRGGAVVAGMAAIAAAGAGAALLARRQQQPGKPALPAIPAIPNPENRQPAIPQNKANWKKRAAIAATVAGGVAGSAAAYRVLDEKYELTDKAIEKAYEKIAPITAMDDVIEKLPLSKEHKEQAVNMVGAAKMHLATTMYKRRGLEVAKIDTENNSVTFKDKSGNLQTVGSAGSRVLTFNSSQRGEKLGYPEFEMGFAVNSSYDQDKKVSRKHAVKIIKMTNAAYETHLENLPDDAYIKAKPYDKDEVGKKRQSIYKKKGFKEGYSEDGYLYAMKKKGKFAEMPDKNIDPDYEEIV